ncbi:ABC transporter substrate-binding protein [Nocardioides sp.]|uniref:ABC transporter substrate-binding protein n=1 Tax=Nocardioides sp. TaxID=35761 RepID=UPI002630F0CB|nr:ABC transporter substrate-binding protein [Nocardioides sp.]
MTTSPLLRRRAVLVGAGAVTALAATASISAEAAGRRRIHVGVLTASRHGSTAASERGDALVAGLRIGLGTRLRRLSHREVDGGYQGLSAAAEALIAGGAEVVVAAVTPLAARDLETLCRARGVALVVAGVGAHVAVPSRTTGSPTALYTGTQHWQSAYSVGQWSRRHLGRRLHQIVAAPDAGYDSVFALRRGFTGAGGTVVGTTVTDVGHGAGLSAALADVRRTKPSVIAISASGDRAVTLVKALRQAGVTAKLVLDPTVVEPGTVGRLGKAGQGAHAGGTHLDPQRQAALGAALRRAGAKRVDAFSALGYDTGLLIAAGLDRLGSRRILRLPAVLAGARVHGVRGLQQVSARGTVTVPLAVRKVTKRASGARVAVEVVRRPRIAADAPAMAVVRGRLASGYVNEYLTT